MTPNSIDFIVISLPYTVPAGKTLYITTYSFSGLQINAKDFFSARVVYENQELTGTGSFIGYLR